jgi:ABC-type transport system substrate-binding protein/serine/threonine protein kinase
MIGQKLANRYELIKEIGRGGMGVVYLANDPVLDREVAVKVVTPDMVSPESGERFKREARVVAKMDHPSIVSVYDSGEADGALFFVMPFVEGTNFRAVLRNQNLQLGELIEIGIQIADALDYSHSRGVVHRDIKPENIMVQRKEGEGIRARVTDFGLAMIPSQDRLTKTATVVGTVTYMSPEQVAGNQVTSASDIYSLGTVLYESLVGQTPFSGEVQALVYRISHELPVPPRQMAAEIDEEVEDVLLQCLEKDPAKRPSGKEVMESLSNYRNKLHSTGRHRTSLPTSPTMSFQMARPQMRPFAGRDKEFGELQRKLNIALTGECQFILIGGEAGIGKSRLLEELENLSKVRGLAVLHGRFVEANHALPYQGYCETIQEYFRTRNPSTSSSDFSDLASDLIALFPVLAEVRDLARSSDESVRLGSENAPKKFEDRSTIFEMLARTLIRMAAGKPLLLLLEDLHAADVSIEALEYIVRRLAPTPTLIVGTYRTTEVDKRHRLSKLLSAFKGDKRFTLIQLGPLSASNHRVFLQQLMGGSALDDDLAARFFQATEGNPYFTTELVRSLMDAGAIVRDDTGTMRLSNETALTMEELPVTIQQAVEERIDRLPENLREVLAFASVLGRSFEFADLEKLSEQEQMEEAVEQLIRSGFIEEDRQSRSDRLAFSSGVVRDVLYTSLPRRKRRALHRKHAEELESRNRGRLERVHSQLFEHYVHADVPEKVLEYGFALARKSLDAFSPEDALRVMQTVLDFLEEEEKGLAYADAKRLSALAQRMLGNPTAAMKDLEDGISVYEKTKEDSRALESILEAAQIAWHGLKIEDTRRWVDRGLQLARRIQDSANLTKLLSLAGTVANMRGDFRSAQQYFEEAEKLKPAREEATVQFAAGGTISVALAAKCEAVHPANTFSNEEAEVLANIFETLVTTDEQGNLLPHLCERWETLNDGALFLFVLRKEIRLHDGKRLTAQEVKLSMENGIRALKRSMPPAFAAIRGLTEFQNNAGSQLPGLIALSENIIEIQLDQKIPIYPALLTDLRTAIALPGEKTDQLVGTGPFKTFLMKPEEIILDRSSDYWKGTSALVDRIQFDAGLSSSEIASGFREGRFDLVRDLLPEDFEDILRDGRLQAHLVETPQKDVYFALFHNDSEIGKSIPLRQAMAGVARMSDLVPQTVGRLAQPAQGLLPPGILGHDPGKRHALLTLEKAKELVASTGLPIPIRVRASVQPILQDRYSALTRAVFGIWSEIGVEISIQTPTQESFNESYLKNEGIDLILSRWIGDYDDPDTFTYSLFHSEIGELRKYFSSLELDAKMERARAERHPQVRERLYRDIENWMLQQGIIFPLFHDIDYRIANPSIQRLALSNIPPFVTYSSLAKSENVPTLQTVKTLKGALQIPMWGELPDLDPAGTITGTAATVFPTIFETLTRATDNARVTPWLASSYQAEDGGKRFRFRLREGVRFHDGRRLTSRDVRYSFERALQRKEGQGPSLLSPVRGASKVTSGSTTELEGLQIVSASEFVVELEKPLSFFPAILAYTALAIIPEGTGAFRSNWRSGCVGTGPYRLTDFQGRTMKLEANPNYWIPGIPKTDGIEFTFGLSGSQTLAGFKSGRFSVAWNLVPSDADELLHESEFASRYQEIPSLATQYIGFNIHNGPFADEKIRQRFVQSIDWDSLIRRRVGRVAARARSLTPPALLGYEPPQQKQWSSVTQGKVSEPIDVTVGAHGIYESKYDDFTKELTTLLREKGFVLHFLEGRIEDVGYTLMEKADINLTNWIADYPDADTFLYSLLHSQTGFIRKLCGTPEVDQLLERSRTETDATARQAIFAQIEDIIHRHYYVLPLFHEQLYCFFRPEVSVVPLNFFDPVLPFEKISLT